MKKLLKLILTTMLAVAILVGCGSEKKVSKTGAYPEKNQTVAPEPVVKSDGSFDTGEVVATIKPTLSPEEADFRSLKWGMTKDEVTEVEGTGYSKPKDYILYYTRVREEGYPADAEYVFVDGKLAQGEFFIFDNKESKTIEFKDYEALVSDLKARFGEPLTDEKTFLNAEDSDKKESEYIDLVMKNEMIRRTKWILEDKGTELRVVLHSRQGKICIGLQYKQIGAVIPKD